MISLLTERRMRHTRIVPATFMEITDVRVRPARNNEEVSRFRGTASITIDDCFVVHDISIIETAPGKFLLGMPSKRDHEGRFRDTAHPLNSETRERLTEAVVKAYKEKFLENTDAPGTV